MGKLKCFIACAFGRSDVDSIYNSVIKKTLRNLNIEPLRVDEITHNSKIDHKIIELINSCDFAIVDLTYARPSAYYEAGYAEGLRKKVIYMSRYDHTKPKETDENGNLRIHFDLLTQNLILWKKNTESVSKQLAKRINLIAGPILQKQTKHNLEKIARDNFGKRSVVDKIATLRKIAPSIFEKNKIVILDVKWGDILGRIGRGKLLTLVYCDFFSNLTIRDIRYLSNAKPFDKSRLQQFPNINRIFLIVVTLNRLSAKSIQTNLPTHRQLNNESTFHTSTQGKDIWLAFIDNVKSEDDFTERFKGIMCELSPQRLPT